MITGGEDNFHQYYFCKRCDKIRLIPLTIIDDFIHALQYADHVHSDEFLWAKMLYKKIRADSAAELLEKCEKYQGSGFQMLYDTAYTLPYTDGKCTVILQKECSDID